MSGLSVQGLTAGLLTLWAVALAGSAAALPSNCSQSGSTVTCIFHPIGKEQSFVVPHGVSSIRVVAIGGAGGNGGKTGSHPEALGGFGAHVAGNLAVTAGKTLYLEVGGNGSPGGPGTAGDGGFNGGAAGGSGSDGGGGGGGGATDIRTVSDTHAGTLASRLVVAAGGGGGGAFCPRNLAGACGGSQGGDAGSPGANGAAASGGAPGTASAGGAGGAGSGGASRGADGSAGRGGAGGNARFDGGGGGGGGVFGGGGGGGNNTNAVGGGGGGGGSSDIAHLTGSTGVDHGIPSEVEIRYTQPAAARPLKLAVSPTHAGAGRHTCFAFHTTSDGHPVADATIHLAGHTAHASHTGHATICATLHRRTYHPSATKHGYHTAHATIHTTAAPRPRPRPKPPSFTG